MSLCHFVFHAPLSYRDVALGEENQDAECGIHLDANVSQGKSNANKFVRRQGRCQVYARCPKLLCLCLRAAHGIILLVHMKVSACAVTCQCRITHLHRAPGSTCKLIALTRVFDFISLDLSGQFCIQYTRKEHRLPLKHDRH